jgi:hypothetical protein
MADGEAQYQERDLPNFSDAALRNGLIDHKLRILRVPFKQVNVVAKIR